MLFYGNFHHGVIQAFLMNPLFLIHCTLKNLHGYLTITEVMAGLILLFIVSQRPIINSSKFNRYDSLTVCSY